MARLFITPREIDFINDIHKEIIKDVIGQKIYLFPISAVKTRVHEVYGESQEKIFENPIEIDCRVVWSPPDTSTSRFGTEKVSKLEVYISERDMIQREILVTPGDFISYGTIFYEIVTAVDTHNIYGQIEHMGGLKVTAVSSRRENFIAKVFGPSSENYTDADAVQESFYQQRGVAETLEGKTHDTRDLQRKGVLEAPLTGPSEISSRGTLSGSAGSSFYDEQG